MSFLFLVVIPLIYIPAVFYGFVQWDDILLTRNSMVTGFSPAIFWHYDPELYIPFTFLSYQIETLFGGSPHGMHAVNIALHTANSYLVYRILGKNWASFMTALLWGIHPLNTEAVVWISGRKDLLYSFFLLLSVFFFLRERHKTSIALFASSLLSKVTGAVLPVIMWLYGERRSTVPFFVLSFVFGIIALFGGKPMPDILTVIPVTLKGMGFGIMKIFVPLHLSVIYVYDGWYYEILLLVVACIILRKHALAYIVVMLPMAANVFRQGEWYFFSDRYAYLAMLFIMYPLILRLSKYRQRYMLYFIVPVLMFLTVLQTGVWKNTDELFLNVLRYYESSTAYNNVGVALMERGIYDKADAVIKRSIAIHPTTPAYYNLCKIEMERQNLRLASQYCEAAVQVDTQMPHVEDLFQDTGGLFLILNDYDKAEFYLRKALEHDPDNEDVLYNLQMLKARKSGR